MNLTQAIFLVNKGARAMRARYEPGLGDDQYNNPNGTKVKNAIFKTLDKEIKVGDLVVVPTSTRHGFTVVKVVEADISIDFEDKTPIEWIVSRVDLSAHKVLVEQEEQLTDEIRKAEMEVRRNQLANALNLSDSIKSLPLAAA